MQQLKKILPFIVLLLFIFLNCSFHPRIKSELAYVKIKPIAPLPDYEKSNVPVNLIISIENVADMSSSYKNKIDLYINKYIIEPDEVYNYKSDYKYNMKLEEGQYNVKAVYYAHTGWQEKRFTIETKEPVKIYLNRTATLSIKLEKNWWGAPVDRKNYFQISYLPVGSISN